MCCHIENAFLIILIISFISPSVYAQDKTPNDKQKKTNNILYIIASISENVSIILVELSQPTSGQTNIKHMAIHIGQVQ